MNDGSSTTLVFGAGRNLKQAIRTHLFIICPNNSGSTFLKEALATSRATWNLAREGQNTPGYAGPVPGPGVALIWASTPALRERLMEPGAYDWERSRRASVLPEPRARCGGRRCSSPSRRRTCSWWKSWPDASPTPSFCSWCAIPMRSARASAATCETACRRRSWPSARPRHVVACLEQQRRNVESHRSDGILFTYETMCAEPRRVAHRIQGLVPEVDDLELRQRLPVKGQYDEMLTDMNARQFARLEPQQITALNRVFRVHREVLGYFGYELLGD